MPTFGYVEYEHASPEVKAVYDDIMRTRNVDWISNFWKSIAHDPGLLRRTWETLKDIMQPGGALDPLTKEMLYLAVSASNQCHYCIATHTAAAWKAGMNAAMFGEMMAIVGMANETNRLVSGYQVEVDDRFKVRDEGWKQYPDPRDVVRTYLRGFESGDIQAIRAVLDPEVKAYEGMQEYSLKDLEAYYGMRYGAFGDYRVEIQVTTLANGEWVSMITMTSALHREAGRRLSVRGILMCRVVKGKIVEIHSQWDSAELARQLAGPEQL